MLLILPLFFIPARYAATVSDIAPAAANKLKRVSKHFSYLKKKASKIEDKDFKVLDNFPFFVNVNIQLSHLSNGDEEVAMPSHLRSSRGGQRQTLPGIDVLVKLEVMLAKQRTEVDIHPSESSQAQASYNKFMSLIQNKQLSQHHNQAEVISVQADTEAGFYAFTMRRHEMIVKDLECLAHALTQQACLSGAATHHDSSLLCYIEEHENADHPHVVMHTQLLSGGSELKMRIVLEPRLVMSCFAACRCDVLQYYLGNMFNSLLFYYAPGFRSTSGKASYQTLTAIMTFRM